jgi:hypothetical protein
MFIDEIGFPWFQFSLKDFQFGFMSKSRRNLSAPSCFDCICGGERGGQEESAPKTLLTGGRQLTSLP